MKVAGGCYCGEIRFEAEGALEAAFQCHCRECQYITGGNPNIVMAVSYTHLTLPTKRIV